MPNGVSLLSGNTAQLQKPSRAISTSTPAKTAGPAQFNTTDTVSLGNGTDSGLAQADKLRAMSRGFGSGSGVSGHSTTMLVRNNDMMGQMQNGNGARLSVDSPTMRMHTNSMIADIQANTADKQIDSSAHAAMGSKIQDLLMN